MLTYEVKNYLIVDKSEKNLVFIYFCLVAYLARFVYLIKKVNALVSAAMACVSKRGIL